jgi:hypothetical protein
MCINDYEQTSQKIHSKRLESLLIRARVLDRDRKVIFEDANGVGKVYAVFGEVGRSLPWTPLVTRHVAMICTNVCTRKRGGLTRRCTRPRAVCWPGAEAPRSARRVASRCRLVQARGRVSVRSVRPTNIPAAARIPRPAPRLAAKSSASKPTSLT